MRRIPKKSASRTIIFGDIHGCIREWKRLLRKLKVTPRDRLISVGDLICKGPDSAAVLDLAMSLPNLECVVGNHEMRFLACWKKGVKANIKPYDRTAVKNMGRKYRKYMRWIAKWPLYLRGRDWIVVHAGIQPNKSLARQNPVDLTHLRTIGPKEKPWYESYKGRRTIVFGHWVIKKPLIRRNAIGLDTGCVYGGKLSALVLPEKKIVSVKAKKIYCKR